MLQDDRHLTTEQLSAFLDGQAEIEEHLKTCAECRLRLADLQQTVALLRQLPQPALPRSFTLPASTSTTTIQPERHLHAVASKPAAMTSPRKKGWSRPLRVTVRTLSALAAVIGIFFLLSGLLSFGYPRANTSAPAAYNANSGKADSSKQGGSPAVTSNGAQNATPTSSSGVGQSQSSSTIEAASATASDSATKSSAATSTQQAISARPSPTATPGYQPSTPQDSQFTLPSFDTPGMRAIAGILLIVLAIIGALLLRLQRKSAGA